MKKLFLGNLPYAMTEAELGRIIGTDLGIKHESLKLVMDRETGKPRGFGFLELASDEAAEAAKKLLEGYPLPAGRGTRPLHVDFAKQEERRGGGGGGGPRSGGGGGDRRGGGGGDRRDGGGRGGREGWREERRRGGRGDY